MADPVADVARCWFEQVWNQRRAETIDELLTSNSVCYGDDGPLIGPQAFRERMYAPFLAAFPDLRVTVEGVVAEGDHAVVRWSAEGTHTGGGLGFGPSGKAIAFRGITWLRIDGGKLAEGWQHSNIPEVPRTLSG
jgi:steroid delta-isomerase-like uncharacterized protein